MFISVEGPDCCGKGTQSKLLAERLGAKPFKFPDRNTPIGALIYSHLFEEWHARPLDEKLSGKREEINALMFQCMQLANRLEHAHDISTTLLGGQDVVSDRYIASGIVYGGSDGLDPEYILRIQQYLPQPDLNILLDLDVSDIRTRMEGRGDTPDRYENLDKLADIIQRYRMLWKEMAIREGEGRWIMLDARKSMVETAANIIEVVKQWHAYTTGTGRWPSDQPNFSNPPRSAG